MPGALLVEYQIIVLQLSETTQLLHGYLDELSGNEVVGHSRWHSVTLPMVPATRSICFGVRNPSIYRSPFFGMHIAYFLLRDTLLGRCVSRLGCGLASSFSLLV